MRRKESLPWPFVLLGAEKFFSFSLVHVASTPVPEKEDINAFVLLGGEKGHIFFYWSPPFSLTHLDLMIPWT